MKQQPSQRRRKQRKDPPQSTSANLTPSGVPGYLLASENGNKRNTQQPDAKANGSSSIDPSSLRGQSLKSLKPSTELDGFRGGVPRELVKQQPQLPQPLANTSNRPPPPSGLRVAATKTATPAPLHLPALPVQGHSKPPTPTAKVSKNGGKPIAGAGRIHGGVQKSQLSTAPLLSPSTHSRPQVPAMFSRLRPEAPAFVPAAAMPPPPPPPSTLSPQPSPQRQQTRQPKSPQKINSPSEPPPWRRRSSQHSSWNTVRKSRLSPPCSSYSPFTDWRYMTNDTVLTPTTWGADPHTREGYLSSEAKLRSRSAVVHKNLHTMHHSVSDQKRGQGWGEWDHSARERELHYIGKKTILY